MFSIREGGPTWQASVALVRALTAFGAARVVFALFGVRPTVYVAVLVVLMLLSWDVWRLRFVKQAPFSIPNQLTSALRFKIGAGFVASSVAGFVFLHV